MTETLSRWFCGDQNAVQFANNIYEAAQIWDDVVDEGDVSQFNKLMQFMAFNIERDLFYRSHREWLKPALLQMYLSWRDANVLERDGTAEDVRKAWMLRAGIYGVFSVMAWLCGGEDHSKNVGPEIWRAYGETQDDILKEFGHA